MKPSPAPWLVALALLPLAVILVPVAWLVARGLEGGALGPVLGSPVVTEALALSLWTSVVALGLTILLGTPLAWLLARKDFPGQRLIDTIIDLPMVLPPAVAGLALLMAFSRTGLVDLAFTRVAVVLAQMFVAAPFYVRAVRSGFEGLDETLEQVAATLGASPASIFFRVSIPLALPALVGGAVMSWARALGEFGATIFFAGNLPGVTQTMPLAIYSAMESNLDAALALALVQLGVSALLLFAFKRVSRGA